MKSFFRKLFGKKASKSKEVKVDQSSALTKASDVVAVGSFVFSEAAFEHRPKLVSPIVWLIEYCRRKSGA